MNRIFPICNIRFISLLDQYDSIKDVCGPDVGTLAKTIINHFYSSDISKKIKSAVRTKQLNGKYISAQLPYGYKKYFDTEKTAYVVDEKAAEVVKNIFKWKLSGMSCQSIADKLNGLGVLSPFEYKKSIGLKFSTSFKINATSKWSSVTVKRILVNETYTGAVVQGKTATPNYKIKQKVTREKSDWIKVENVHEAIISHDEFALIADLLGRDTYKTEIHPFSSMLFCSRCGNNLIRKVSTIKNKKYISHACLKNNKNGKRAGCSGIRIKESELIKAVSFTIKNYINIILNIDETVDFIDKIPPNQEEIKRLLSQVDEKKSELDKLENRKIQLYGDYKDGEITRAEYNSFKKNYDLQISDIQNSVKNLQTEIDRLTTKKNRKNNKWIEYVNNLHLEEKYTARNPNIELSRELIVKLIDKIIVYEGGRIEIIFRFDDEFKEAFK